MDLPISWLDGATSADAKLSTAQRKKLQSSTFCGPNRSFPVPDCAHVTAARRLIGRANVGASTKSRILACVSRKAKSLGCDASKGKDEQENYDAPEISQLIATEEYDATREFLSFEETTYKDNELDLFSKTVARIAALFK